MAQKPPIYSTYEIKGIYTEVLDSAGNVTIGNHVFIENNAAILKAITKHCYGTKRLFTICA